jgi:hypothetical protein
VQHYSSQSCEKEHYHMRAYEKGSAELEVEYYYRATHCPRERAGTSGMDLYNMIA